MPGIARHTPTLAGSSAVRLIVADTALLPHLGELIAQLIRDNEWVEIGSPIDDVIAASWLALESWYAGHMIGQISYFLSVAPIGWLELDGATYTKDDYPELYAKLPSAWISGENFTLPDVQDVFLSGVGGTGTIATTGGSSTHVLAETEMPSHTHMYTMPVPGPDTVGAGAPIPSVMSVTPASPTGAAGGGQAHENRPSFLALTIAVYSGRA